MTAHAFLKLADVSGGYHPGEPIVRDISLNIEGGDFIGIIGPNGCGKTTLLRLMSRALIPSCGTMMLDGQELTKMPLKEFCRKVAFVPQDTTVNFSFTVFDIVLLGRTPHIKRLHFETKKDITIVDTALQQTQTIHLRQQSINEISSGERQRVFIAKALAQEPILLFLDEPTSHLDIGHQTQILELLRQLNSEKKITVVMILHDLNLASEYCNRIVLMDAGRIFKEGTPEEILTYENIESVYKTVVLVKKNPLNGKPYTIVVSGTQLNLTDHNPRLHTKLLDKGDN